MKDKQVSFIGKLLLPFGLNQVSLLFKIETSINLLTDESKGGPRSSP